MRSRGGPPPPASGPAGLPAPLAAARPTPTLPHKCYFPAEPAGYDPENKFADPVLYFKHREAKVAEEYVKVAEAKVRER